MPRKKLGKKIDVNGNLEDLGNTLSDEDLEKLDSLSKVATSGSYNDLSNKPSIPSIEGLATDQSVDEKLELLQLEFEQGIEGLIGELENSINDKANSSDLSAVATSGSYNDLLNKPTIPTIVTLTQAEYDALETKDENTYYYIKEE